MRVVFTGARCFLKGFRRDAVRHCAGQADAVILSAQLPTTPVPASESLAAAQRLLAETTAAAQVPEVVWADQRAGRLLTNLGEGCAELDAQQLRSLLAAFAASQHMPAELWPDVAEEVPRAMAELPDLHAVHVALLMAALDLRRPDELLREVANLLGQRVGTLSPTGLTAAVVALSQLGPWPQPAPGRALADELLPHMGKLQLNQLSASALAVATLGIVDLGFWQAAHGYLNGNVALMKPRHLADTLLALATTQNHPISLLESLQDRLKLVLDMAEPEEALTCAWALAALRLHPAGILPLLLQRALAIDRAELSTAQSNQIRQVGLSLELEPAAAKARAALTEEVLLALRSEDAIGDTTTCGDNESMEEVCDLLTELGCDFSMSSSVAEFYTVDILLKRGDSQVGIVLDSNSSSSAEVPHDPWATLKLRQLPLLGCPVVWLPTNQWRDWTEEDRRAFVGDLLKGSDTMTE